MARSLIAAAALCCASAVQAQNGSGQEDSDATLVTSAITPLCTVETLASEAIVDPAIRTPQLVTEVIYTCNSVGGITRRVSSRNSGSLVRASQNIPYIVSEDGDPQLSYSAVSLATPLITQVPTFAALTRGSQGTLWVSIPALPARLLAGEYTDTITIEIAPN